MPAVNPNVLVWAREAAGLSLQAAAAKLQISAGGDRLAEYEGGLRAPTTPMLKKMAKAYRRPLLTFYLSAPPTRGETGEDFRSLPQRETADEPLVSSLLRDVKARQSMVREVIEEEQQEGARELPYVGSMSTADSVASVLASIRDQLAIDRVEFRAQGSIDAAFGYLRTKAEAAGIFVLLIGNLGTHHTNLEVSAFRGFALADPVAPFVVINDQDATAAWSFTLLHEIAHLWVGASGVSGAYGESALERFCNEVASEFLMPAQELPLLDVTAAMPLDLQAERITAFAQERLVSRSMVAYRLHRANRISFTQWEVLAQRFRIEWRALREEQKARAREKSGGPTYYVVRRHRLGAALLQLVDRTVTLGLLSPTEAGTVLGVNARSVAPLLSVVHRQVA